MLNKVMLIGNLGADPDVRFTQNGTAVANLRLATTEKWRGKDGQMQEQTEWHKVVTFGRLAEICRDYLSKGARIYIEGKLQTRKWQDQNGNDRYTTEIVAREMKMLSPRNAGGGAPAGGSSGSYDNGFDGGQGGGGLEPGPTNGFDEESSFSSGSSSTGNDVPF